MLVCDKCKNRITLGAKFCPYCGDPVTDEVVCNNCVNHCYYYYFKIPMIKTFCGKVFHNLTSYWVSF